MRDDPVRFYQWVTFEHYERQARRRGRRLPNPADWEPLEDNGQPRRRPADRASNATPDDGVVVNRWGDVRDRAPVFHYGPGGGRLVGYEPNYLNNDAPKDAGPR
jgi:hypothetical protein